MDLVLTIVAHDRPGVVQAVADVVSRCGGNWIDSALARLGGEFAGVVGVAMPHDALARAEDELAALSAQGIAVTVRRARPAPPQGATARLALTCADHPGVLAAVTRTLAAEGVSIETLATRVFSGSMSGEPYFEAKAVVRLPDAAGAVRLRAALEAIADDLMADIEFAAGAGAPAAA